MQETLADLHRMFDEALGHHHAGRLNEAEWLYRRILEHDHRHAFALHMLGVIAHQVARYDIAGDLISQAIALNDRVPAFHSNLGNALKAQGKPVEAADAYRRALERKPDFAEAYSNLGNVLMEQGQLDEAVAAFRQALICKPDLAEALGNLGNALAEQGKLDEAVVSYRRALVFKPELAETHNNLGNILKEQGRLDEAMVAYKQALAHRPEMAEAHCNLGNALRECGKLDDAVAAYICALTHKPDFVLAISNLALVLSEQGHHSQALASIRQSLQCKETADAKSIFVECARDVLWTQADGAMRDLMLRALTEPWGWPSSLVGSTVRFLMTDTATAECIMRVASAWPAHVPARELFADPGFAGRTTDTLLHAMLVSVPVCDLRLERFLTVARHALLETALSPPDDEMAEG